MFGLCCDVVDVDVVECVVVLVVECFGGIDVLVNNVGIIYCGIFVEIGLGVFCKVMVVNFFGVVYCICVVLLSLFEWCG